MSKIIVFADANVDRRREAVQGMAGSGEIHECENTGALLHAVRETMPAVVVIGSLGHERVDGVEAAHHVREIHPGAKVILVADVSSESLVIGALRAGVYEYLKAPVDSIEIAEAVAKAMPSEPHVTENGFESLVGATKEIRDTKDFIRRVAPLNSTVLITGESGTGKEIVARLIHQHSLRAQRPLISVNCAAIPDSLVESELFGHERGAFTGAVARQPGQLKNADRGSLFLDEIGDMSACAQSKMLRVLEQHEIQPLGSSKPISIDIRLIAATHQNLETLIEENRFRRDLYYRLDIVRIHLVPLRERREDIPLLASHFMRKINRVYGRQIAGLTPTALEMLLLHDWPGNVRQLRNVIEAAAAVCESDRISDRDLRALHSFRASEGQEVKKNSAPIIPTRQVKPGRDALLEALQATRWNMTKTAVLLNWSRSTLYRNVARYKIERSKMLQDEPHPECASSAAE